MTIPGWIVFMSWLLHVLHLAISVTDIKKDSSPKRLWWSDRLFAIRLIVVAAAVVIFVALGYGSKILWNSNLTTISNIGASLCVAGMGITFWARTALGNNWSSEPSLKEDHDLVTSGPYKVVRHPMYTGILLASFGSALVAWPFVIVFFISGIVFTKRFDLEEGLMAREFPEIYPQYKARTKRLIPYVW